jgi:hypothetical protein
VGQEHAAAGLSILRRHTVAIQGGVNLPARARRHQWAGSRKKALLNNSPVTSAIATSIM